MKKELLSFVIPCYRSEKTIGSVVNEITEVMNDLSGYDYEVILVNDGSPDGTWEAITEISAKNQKVTGFNLSRNFGQHSALMAGLNQAGGDIIICLDDDGQTPANEAGKLIKGIEDGADVVYARYQHKQHSLYRNMGSALNEWMAHIMLNKPKDLYVSSYFAVKRYVALEMIRYSGSYPYVIGLVLRTTNRIVNVDVDHRKRETGTSGYTFGKLLGLWINGFTAFSVKPLRIATMAGCICAICGFIYGLYTIIKKFVVPGVPLGFSALMSAIIFIGGMLMLMVGLAGEYVGRSYISLNNNPQFVIRESTDDKSQEQKVCGFGDSVSRD